jgi:release factor glutamine methyltransferase
VLIPRPDSEVLIASAVEHFSGTGGPKRILDLGTGPGTLILAALDIWPEATGVGVDRSRRALSYASANARRLGSEERVKFRLGHWADGIDEKFDLILCNPPYVAESATLGRGVAEHEPHEALFAGPEGLADIRQIAPEIPRLLATGGLACIEIDPAQAAAALELLAAEGLAGKVVTDLAGHDRAILLG